jgi:hypothetical protein
MIGAEVPAVGAPRDLDRLTYPPPALPQGSSSPAGPTTARSPGL